MILSGIKNIFFALYIAELSSLSSLSHFLKFIFFLSNNRFTRKNQVEVRLFKKPNFLFFKIISPSVFSYCQQKYLNKKKKNKTLKGIVEWIVFWWIGHHRLQNWHFNFYIILTCTKFYKMKKKMKKKCFFLTNTKKWGDFLVYIVHWNLNKKKYCTSTFNLEKKRKIFIINVSLYVLYI